MKIKISLSAAKPSARTIFNEFLPLFPKEVISKNSKIKSANPYLIVLLNRSQSFKILKKLGWTIDSKDNVWRRTYLANSKYKKFLIQLSDVSDETSFGSKDDTTTISIIKA
jgi:hypothetical protein